MVEKIQQYIETWRNRCYSPDIPDDVPEEIFYKVPSYKRIAIAILKNDVTELGYTPKRSIYYDVLKKIEIEKRNQMLRETL